MTEPLPVLAAEVSSVAQPKTLWQSVLGCKKALASAASWGAGIFVGVVVADGGRFPTWQELVIAGVGAVAAHGVTWNLTNEKPDGGRVG